MEQGDGEGAGADRQIAGAQVLQFIRQRPGLLGGQQRVQGLPGGWVQALRGIEGQEIYDLRFTIYELTSRVGGRGGSGRSGGFGTLDFRL